MIFNESLWIMNFPFWHSELEQINPVSHYSTQEWFLVLQVLLMYHDFLLPRERYSKRKQCVRVAQNKGTLSCIWIHILKTLYTETQWILALVTPVWWSSSGCEWFYSAKRGWQCRISLTACDVTLPLCWVGFAAWRTLSWDSSVASRKEFQISVDLNFLFCPLAVMVLLTL